MAGHLLLEPEHPRRRNEQPAPRLQPVLGYRIHAQDPRVGIQHQDGFSVLAEITIEHGGMRLSCQDRLHLNP